MLIMACHYSVVTKSKDSDNIYRKFLKELIEVIFIHDKKQNREYLEKIERIRRIVEDERIQNPFLEYLKRISEIIKKYKLNGDFTWTFERVRDHLHDDGLRKAISRYLTLGDNEEEVELYLALTIAHVISHNNARSIKVPYEAVEEATKALNEYLRRKGYQKVLREKDLEKNEPSELYKKVIIANKH